MAAMKCYLLYVQYQKKTVCQERYIFNYVTELVMLVYVVMIQNRRRKSVLIR
jgi:hypothetical protein